LLSVEKVIIWLSVAVILASSVSPSAAFKVRSKEQATDRKAAKKGVP